MQNTITVIKGPCIYTENEVLKNSSLIIKNRKIHDIITGSPKTISVYNTLELPNTWHLVPGMIDIHIHGAKGKDVMDASFEALNTISNTLPQEGVTSFLATTMSSSINEIQNAINCVNDFKTQQNTNSTNQGAELLGINLEGPFISKEKAGAQNPIHIIPFDLKLYNKWQKDCDDLIKIITIAPECIAATAIKKY